MPKKMKSITKSKVTIETALFLKISFVAFSKDFWGFLEIVQNILQITSKQTKATEAI